LLKKIELALPLLFLPSFVQIALDMSVDPFNVTPIRFLFFYLPPYHMYTMLLIILTSIIGYYALFNRMTFFRRVFIIGCITFLCMCGHEVYANIGNTFYIYKSALTLPIFIYSLPWWVLIPVPVFILLVSFFAPLKLKAFVFCAMIGVVLYSAQPIFNLDWSTADIILHNSPYLWMLAKGVTYSMWWLLFL